MDSLIEQLETLREDVRIAIEDVLLIDSPEGDSPRNIAANLRRALNSHPTKCSNCDGYGEVMQWVYGDMEKCSKCDGSGEAPR